ncbi:CTP synthase [Bifidobacterium primatium]|uniref:CTP synthase n=1 Tax=Bifidobacterium primatium TaxID=2045438 RepID=UPI001054453B|nr:CTP synthase [Bifidobacterium primatium]
MMLDQAESNRLCIWSRDDAERQMMRRRQSVGELIHVGARCYARPSYWQGLTEFERFRHLARSLSGKHPRWVFGGPTAAVMHGVCDSHRQMRTVHRVIAGNGMVRDTDIVTSHYVTDASYVVVDGVKVTSLPRTVFDCARWMDFPDALAVVDAVLRQGAMGRAALHDSLLRERGRYVGRALHVLDEATGRTYNGGESYVYGVILEERFAKPTIQAEMPCRNENGNPDRVDFLWVTGDGRRVVAELDGRIKYRDESMYRNGSLPDTIIAEKEREERVRMVVDGFVRFSFAEAYRRAPLVRKLEWAGVPRLLG